MDERRFGAGPLMNPTPYPGLIQNQIGEVWLVKIDGSRCLLDCTGGGGAPADAEYLVLAADPTLTDERIATGGDALEIIDGGAGGPATFDVKVDGITIIVNGSNELEVVGSSGGSGLTRPWFFGGN